MTERRSVSFGCPPDPEQLVIGQNAIPGLLEAWRLHPLTRRMVKQSALHAPPEERPEISEIPVRHNRGAAVYRLVEEIKNLSSANFLDEAIAPSLGISSARSLKLPLGILEAECSKRFTERLGASIRPGVTVQKFCGNGRQAVSRKSPPAGDLLCAGIDACSDVRKSLAREVASFGQLQSRVRSRDRVFLRPAGNPIATAKDAVPVGWTTR